MTEPANFPRGERIDIGGYLCRSCACYWKKPGLRPRRKGEVQ